MRTIPPDDLARITDYVAGELTSAEMAATARWIEDDAAREAVVSNLQRSQKALRQRLDSRFDVNRMVETSVRNAGLTLQDATSTIPHSQKGTIRRSTGVNRATPFRHPLVRYVGGMLCAALVIALGVRVIRTEHRPSQIRTFATGLSRAGIVNLDDGTQVILAPNTTLRLENFGAAARTVSLTGEAYFVVPHAAGAPFIVHSGGATTRVLGTAFTLRHTESTRWTHVIVEQGRVSLATKSSAPATLSAGQVGDATDSIVRISPADDKASWINGKLWFRDASLADVLTTLRRWYGYEFRVTDQTLLDRRVTLGLTTRSSADAFSNLEQVLAVKITVVGDTATVTSHLKSKPPATPRNVPYEIWTPTKEVGR